MSKTSKTSKTNRENVNLNLPIVPETPAPVVENAAPVIDPKNLLASLADAARGNAARGTRATGTKTNPIAVKGHTLTHSASIRRFADDLFAGRTEKIGNAEFLTNPTMTRWSDITPLRSADGTEKTVRLNLIDVMKITTDAGTHNYTIVRPDARAILASLDVNARMTEDQMAIVVKMAEENDRNTARQRNARGTSPDTSRMIPFASRDMIASLFARAASKTAKTS